MSHEVWQQGPRHGVTRSHGDDNYQSDKTEIEVVVNFLKWRRTVILGMKGWRCLELTTLQA